MPATIRRSRRQRAVDADRLARAHRSFIQLHRQEEKRTRRAITPIWDPLIRMIIQRMDRAGSHPPVEALFNPGELRQPFNAAMSPRWLRMTESGVRFERDWIDSASGTTAEQRASGLWTIRQDSGPDPAEMVRSMTLIEMPPAMRAAVGDWLRDRQVGVWSRVAASLSNNLRNTLETGLKNGDTTTELQKRVKRALSHYGKVEARRVARTECLPGDTRIDGARVTTIYRRWYEGPLIEIITDAGRKLSGTPNHPVLTVRGWVALGNLTEADGLICRCPSVKDARSARDQYIQHPPTTISQIFNSVAAVGITKRKGTRQPDFHGDGMDGYVDVAMVDGMLSIGSLTAITERSIERVLAPSDRIKVLLATCRTSRHLSPTIDNLHCISESSRLLSILTQCSFDGTFRDSELVGQHVEGVPSAMFRRDFSNGNGNLATAVPRRKQRPPRFGTRPHDACRNTRIINRAEMAPEQTGHGERAFPGDIEIDHPLSIRRIHQFSGHVYNLTTADGYFSANEIYTSNCTGSMNFGEQLARNEAGIQWKEWVSTIDLRTRGADPKRKSKFNHYSAHGQKVANNGVFVVSGEKLKHPGDTSQGASAGNVVNCRCAGVAAFEAPKAQPGGPTPTPESRLPDPLEKRLVPSKATVEFMEDETELLDLAEKIFGKRPTAQDLASLIGAHDDSRVELYFADDGIGFSLTDRARGATARRHVSRTSQGIVMFNHDFKVDQTRTGYGREMLARQVALASRWGVRHIDAYALKAHQYNGYYTWARLGYDSELPEAFLLKLAKLENVPEIVGNAKRISDIMLTEEGRKFWLEHGESWSGRFDLNPTSYSLRTLRNYLRKKDLETGIQSARKEFLRQIEHQASKERRRVEELDMEIDEDEAIFAAVFAEEKARRDREANK